MSASSSPAVRELTAPGFLSVSQEYLRNTANPTMLCQHPGQKPQTFKKIIFLCVMDLSIKRVYFMGYGVNFLLINLVKSLVTRSCIFTRDAQRIFHPLEMTLFSSIFCPLKGFIFFHFESPAQNLLILYMLAEFLRKLFFIAPNVKTFTDFYRPPNPSQIFWWVSTTKIAALKKVQKLIENLQAIGLAVPYLLGKRYQCQLLTNVFGTPQGRSVDTWANNSRQKNLLFPFSFLGSIRQYFQIYSLLIRHIVLENHKIMIIHVVTCFLYGTFILLLYSLQSYPGNHYRSHKLRFPALPQAQKFTSSLHYKPDNLSRLRIYWRKKLPFNSVLFLLCLPQPLHQSPPLHLLANQYPLFFSIFTTPLTITNHIFYFPTITSPASGSGGPWIDLTLQCIVQLLENSPILNSPAIDTPAVTNAVPKDQSCGVPPHLQHESSFFVGAYEVAKLLKGVLEPYTDHDGVEFVHPTLLLFKAFLNSSTTHNFPLWLVYLVEDVEETRIEKYVSGLNPLIIRHVMHTEGKNVKMLDNKMAMKAEVAAQLDLLDQLPSDSSSSNSYQPLSSNRPLSTPLLLLLLPTQTLWRSVMIKVVDDRLLTGGCTKSQRGLQDQKIIPTIVLDTYFPSMNTLSPSHSYIVWGDKYIVISRIQSLYVANQLAGFSSQVLTNHNSRFSSQISVIIICGSPLIL
ncbi:hypothetical protein VP01_526g2 [Puccinia sorghi]|uniref:Uncharacterized protein n=1 Tax=Puccinia sorghi TaxID=27349 RepID=A0A0L6UKE0_9BASI|nr:hypothetical protein VP01_526g2 [Puccinia sorghi]